MPDAQGNFKGINVPAGAWDRIFASGRLERVEVKDERGDTIGTTLEATDGSPRP